MAYIKLDKNTFKSVETKTIEKEFNISQLKSNLDFLQARKKDIDAEIDKIKLLIQEAKTIGIE